MPVSVRLPVVGLLLVLGFAGCTAEQAVEATPKAEPTAELTPLDDYETSDLTLARSTFCGRVSAAAITETLGTSPIDEESWRPGVRLPGSDDISNEFGCAWTAGHVTARAWVFAPPMTAERAEDAAASAIGSKCRRLRSAPPLGAPGVAQSCGLDTGDALVGFYGLVGDAWVGCEVTGPTGIAEVDLVGEWCVAVLEALRSS